MKHTNFNMPTLRRITLFAILLLGTMPMWAEAYTGNLYVVGLGINGTDYSEEGGHNKGILFTTHSGSHYELDVQTNHQTGDGFKLITRTDGWDPQFYGVGSESRVEVTKTGTFALHYHPNGDDKTPEVKFMPEAEGHFKLVVDLADRDNGTMRVELLNPTNGLSVKGPLTKGNTNPDADWDKYSNMTKNGDVYTWTYSNLPAGTYKFKFSAQNTSDDTWLSANAATKTTNNCELIDADNWHNFQVRTTIQQDLHITVTYKTVNGEVKATVNATSGEPVPDCPNCKYLGEE